MTQRAKLTKRTVDAQKAGSAEYVVWDSDIRGYGLRVHPSGRKTYFLKYRTRDGKRIQIKLNVGVHGDVTPDGARKIAERWRDEIAGGGDPRARMRATVEKNGDSFKSVAKNFIKRHVKKEGLRSQPEIERQLKRYIYPAWECRSVDSIRTEDVAELLDTVEDNNGATQADRVLATVRAIFNWHASRKSNYLSPVKPKMARTKPAERKRRRFLSDDEIRSIWSQLEGPFGGLVKTLLLTGQRLGKVSTMRWQDIEDDIWTLPTEAREKNNPGSLKLSQAVLGIIREQPVIAGCPYVFPGRGGKQMRGFSPLKRKLDKIVNEARAKDGLDPIPHWTLHDLRRRAKTIMGRAGVRPDISERTLGHIIPGVEGVYDRHAYSEEKGAALVALASTVELILNPPKGNVVSLAAGE
jgi:integrase